MLRTSAFLEIRARQLRQAGDDARARIVLALSAPEFAGMNPVNIERKLRKRFTPPPADLFAVILQETALAQSRAKLEALRAEGVERYDVETVGDDHVCEACARIAAGGPYRVAAPVLPGWPHCKACRCTILPVD